MALLSLLLVGWLQAPPVGSEQVLVVLTADWEAKEGSATLYEGAERVFGPVPVHVGATGLGWGDGLFSTTSLPGPRKREGDQRAPAGVFLLGPGWQREEAHRLYCVDDVDAPEYNRVVRLQDEERPRWSSAEAMEMYRVAIFVQHNPSQTSGQGSCIFLHDGGEATLGCSAFQPSIVDRLYRRLRPGARLAQMPRAAYRRYALFWGLPAEPDP